MAGPHTPAEHCQRSALQAVLRQAAVAGAGGDLDAKRESWRPLGSARGSGLLLAAQGFRAQHMNSACAPLATSQRPATKSPASTLLHPARWSHVREAAEVAPACAAEDATASPLSQRAHAESQLSAPPMRVHAWPRLLGRMGCAARPACQAAAIRLVVTLEVLRVAFKLMVMMYYVM